ncbi:968_t:CDS:2 [Entrophospora sp. SA101]|nr:968_t:CDS:2 [Entrophospora sp. SA101]CAJ0834405.1 7231_t:CDS:2 [Entrophospora sp. SA101]
MAPKTGENNLIDSATQSHNEGNSLSANDQKEEIWSSILKSVASSKITPSKSILILGDRESGKSTLIRHLKGEEEEDAFEAPMVNGGALPNGVKNEADEKNEFEKKTKDNDLALSFTYVEVKDDEAEDTLARLGIYQLAGSEDAYRPLLKFALNYKTLPDSLVVIVLDWTRPWTFIETLQRWIKFIESSIKDVCSEGGTGSKSGWTKGKAVVDELKESLERFIQKYTEPADPNNVTNELPLGPGTLTTNLGIPIVVVCTKSDYVEREFDYKEELFDFIQQSLRTICLKYGAALFYTTIRQEQTFTDLRQYILHRLLGTKALSGDAKATYAFSKKAHVVDRDTVMVPSGWDSWGKIKISKEGFDCEGLLNGWDLDMGYRDSSPQEGEEIVSSKKIYEDTPLSVQTLIEAEDEQEFFKRHFDTLQKANNERPPSVVGPMGAPQYTYGNIGAEIPDLDSAPVENLPVRPTKTKPAAAIPAPTAPITSGITVAPNNASQPNQNEVLANFFQALLIKKGTAASSSPSLKLGNY